jgi:hypothetical protein
VDYFSGAVVQAPLPVATATHQARRSSVDRRRIGLAAGAFAVVGAVIAVWLIGAGKARLSNLDRPSGSQLPLVTSLITHDPTGGPSFDIQLPNSPSSGTVATHPVSDGSLSFGTVRLGGPQLGVLLLLKGPASWGSSPRVALVRESTNYNALKPQGPIRRTLVGTTPAYARDFQLGRHIIREFRFSRDGHVYGAGIVYAPGDTISLDTALAALRTFRWLG